MKKFIASFILLILSCNICLADNCDWTQITMLPNGNYSYNPILNLCVGNLVQDSATKDKQLADLNQAITDKNAALTASDQRATLWSNTSASLESRLQTIDSEEKHNDWIFFGLGALTVIGAGWMASRLIHP